MENARLPGISMLIVIIIIYVGLLLEYLRSKKLKFLMRVSLSVYVKWIKNVTIKSLSGNIKSLH